MRVAVAKGIIYCGKSMPAPCGCRMHLFHHLSRARLKGDLPDESIRSGFGHYRRSCLFRRGTSGSRYGTGGQFLQHPVQRRSLCTVKRRVADGAGVRAENHQDSVHLGNPIPSPQSLVVSQNSFTPGFSRSPITGPRLWSPRLSAQPWLTNRLRWCRSRIRPVPPFVPRRQGASIRYEKLPGWRFRDAQFQLSHRRRSVRPGNLSAYQGNQGTGNYWLENPPDQTGQLNIAPYV